MITEQEIINFIEKEYWKSNLNSDSDIFNTIQIDGDDCDELLNKYQIKYEIDMSEYLWYFHHQEEGSWNSFGGIIFKSPNKKVKRIPITPKMLTEFANSKKWHLNYPEHSFPKYRYDIVINQIIFIVFIAFVIYHYFIKKL